MSSVICSVRGCHNNWKKMKQSLSQSCFEHEKKRSQCCGPAFKLFPPPTKEPGLSRWLQALNLKHPPKRPYVCSFHFVEKKPTPLHPYPEKWLGYNHSPSVKRKMTRQTDTSASGSVGETMVQFHEEEKSVSESLPVPDHAYAVTSFPDQNLQVRGLAPLHREVLRTDHLSLLYTGLPLEAFSFVADQLLKGYKNTFELDGRDQVLMTLMKLRLNLLPADLAERFHVSQAGVTKIMSLWLDLMEEKMRCFIPWLPRQTILTTTPLCFKEHYPSTTCVIDCSETPLQKPHSPDSRGESHSLYNGQNTIKYLVAMAPCGLIMFVSAAYGGRCSDRFMTSDSGLLEYLRPEDVVMADRRFVISDLLRERQVKLVTTESNRKGLSEDTTNRRMVNVRVHVEKATRRLKNFRILSQALPMNLAHKCDQILRICAALSNLRGDIIHEEEKD